MFCTFDPEGSVFGMEGVEVHNSCWVFCMFFFLFRKGLFEKVENPTIVIDSSHRLKSVLIPNEGILLLLPW